MPEHLFVYGTLLPDFVPREMHSVVCHLKALGTGSTPGRLYDLGSYPGAVFDETTATSVRGQIFELPNEGQLLDDLDRYEGYRPGDLQGSLFRRERLRIIQTDGATLTCWAYAYNRDPGNAPLIPDGDYAAWTKQRQSKLDRH